MICLKSEERIGNAGGMNLKCQGEFLFDRDRRGAAGAILF